MEGHVSGVPLSGLDAHRVWVRDFANTVVSRGHSRQCPAYVESETGITKLAPPKWLSNSAVYFGWQLVKGSDVSCCGPLELGPRCRMSLTGCGRKLESMELCLRGRHSCWESKTIETIFLTVINSHWSGTVSTVLATVRPHCRNGLSQMKCRILWLNFSNHLKLL